MKHARVTAGAAVVKWKLGVLLGGSWNRRCCVSPRFREERTQQNKPRGALSRVLGVAHACLAAPRSPQKPSTLPTTIETPSYSFFLQPYCQDRLWDAFRLSRTPRNHAVNNDASLLPLQMLRIVSGGIGRQVVCRGHQHDGLPLPHHQGPRSDV